MLCAELEMIIHNGRCMNLLQHKFHSIDDLSCNFNSITNSGGEHINAILLFALNETEV